MRLDQLREDKIAKRKGNTGRTLIMLVWLGMAFVVAYFATNWLFANRLVTPSMFYDLGLSQAVPELAIQGFLMFLIVIVIQTFLFIGFAMTDSTGRRKSGVATLHSYTKDSFGNDYRN
jgi:ABC-type sugar transport system permease subunit